MTKYPQYIIDEADRLCNAAMSKQQIAVTGSPKMHPFKVVICDLLIESGFKPPVDPLLEDVWFCAAYADRNEEDFDGFKGRLLEKGLTVTITKTGEA
jgi:hypothetical protein